MRTILTIAFVLLSICTGSQATFADEPLDASAAERLFTLRVLPLLKEKCFGCHGGDTEDVRGDYDLLTREGMLKGGESEEPSIVPGKPDESPLYLAVLWDGYEMPPKENDRLTKTQTEYIRQWIAAGAPWPNASRQRAIQQKEWSVTENEDGIIVSTSGGLADDWTYRRYQADAIWAFRPVTKPTVPAGHDNPIDAFHEAKLAAAGHQPAPRADAPTLIRRATYDLLGLPPTPAEIDQFLAAWEVNPTHAWDALLTRLLDSPHYGERWGQHWLDVTRYADTGGYSNDYERSNMWRYRDYVVRALNSDMPYDQFIVEQIAGDELADQSLRKRFKGNQQQIDHARMQGKLIDQESEWLVATGFLRMGPWDPAMVKNAEARQIYIDDVINNVGQTFLSTTMRCFKCHDHKFDPLPTRDYYRVYAAFAATQLAERPAPFLPVENRKGFEEGRAMVERLLAFATEKKNALVHKRETAARAWFKERNLPYISEKDRRNLPDEQKPPRHVGLDHEEKGRLKVREQDEWIWTRRLERYQPMVQSVYNGPDPNFLNARKLRMRTGAKGKLANHILLGGALEAPGEAVMPGVLSAVEVPVSVSAMDPYVISDDLEGRRLALANWIADERNPLTSRSIVNRVWQHHFGKPLAGNPNNFGVKGARPTHPELLDWLASDFVEGGWTLKRLHRKIMSSAVYQQASHHEQLATLRNEDPSNDLLAYFPKRRLTAEEIRDSMLAITGELNPQLGGVPIMPEMNMEVALQPRMIQFSIAPAYQPSRSPEQRNRRSLYAYRVRGQADPFLEVFNQPNPNESCDLRDSASVSPQAFTLLNSEVMSDRSLAFALRLESEATSIDAQVKRGFSLALGREPTAIESQRLVAYVRAMRDYHAKVQPEPVKYPTRIVRSLVEEFSGEPFEYDEILPVFENYEADKKPADVGPKTRALADLCLLLFNSNEFVFVY